MKRLKKFESFVVDEKQDIEYGSLDLAQYMVWYVMFALSIYFFGWMIGFIVYNVAYLIIEKLLKVFMNLEMMSAGDEQFFGDDYRGTLNIVAYQKYEKFKAQEVAQTMMQRACQFRRMKSKVVKFLGNYMFEEMTDEDMMLQANKVCPIITDIHNDKQLAEFMIDHQSNRLGLNFIQWRIYLIPDYSETESVLVFKIHHSVADGIALILLMCSLTDHPKLEDYP